MTVPTATTLPYPEPDQGDALLDPIARFGRWWQAAKDHGDILEPNAMTLALATTDGRPNARIVLLHKADEDGFVFFTNSESRKGETLKANPFAALCFHYMPMRKQVRVEGHATQVSDEESDAYFASRRRESQIGAWASHQSRPLDARSTFEARIAEYTEKFDGKTVPRPPHWYGWRVKPDMIEFWTERPFRLHHREVYTPDHAGWAMHRLYP